MPPLAYVLIALAVVLVAAFVYDRRRGRRARITSDSA